MQDYVYFDLETQRSANDVGGWGHKDKMGMSVGVTYSTKTNQYHIYSENQADQLIEQLVKADLVIGFNHISFDYEVLLQYTILDLKTQTRNLDLMVDLEEILGHRIKLDSVAKATLGPDKSKTAEGLQAIKWWQEYKSTGNKKPLLEIAEYCAYDVKVTRLVHEYGYQNGHIKYADRAGREQQTPLTWSPPN